MPDIPVMALTATARSSVREKVKHLLALKDIKEVIESPMTAEKWVSLHYIKFHQAWLFMLNMVH